MSQDLIHKAEMKMMTQACDIIEHLFTVKGYFYIFPVSFFWFFNMMYKNDLRGLF